MLSHDGLLSSRDFRLTGKSRSLKKPTFLGKSQLLGEKQSILEINTWGILDDITNLQIYNHVIISLLNWLILEKSPLGGGWLYPGSALKTANNF